VRMLDGRILAPETEEAEHGPSVTAEAH
jgi:hypothetical protein